MKKLVFIALLFAACKQGPGIYVSHTPGVDDTLIIENGIILNRTGYIKKDGTRGYHVRQLDVQPQYDGNKVVLRNLVFTKIR
jgi:hypothetical protein